MLFFYVSKERAVTLDPVLECRLDPDAPEFLPLDVPIVEFERAWLIRLPPPDKSVSAELLSAPSLRSRSSSITRRSSFMSSSSESKRSRVSEGKRGEEANSSSAGRTTMDDFDLE